MMCHITGPFRGVDGIQGLGLEQASSRERSVAYQKADDGCLVALNSLLPV